MYFVLLYFIFYVLYFYVLIGFNDIKGLIKVINQSISLSLSPSFSTEIKGGVYIYLAFFHNFFL